MTVVLSKGDGSTPDIGLSRCRNCHNPITAAFRYCPECGQDTDTARLALGELIREAWQEFLYIDGKLARTLFLLLFKPGRLTREYIEGKRVRYISPFKMYLVVAAIFFTLAAWQGSAVVEKLPEEIKRTGKISLSGPIKVTRATTKAPVPPTVTKDESDEDTPPVPKVPNAEAKKTFQEANVVDIGGLPETVDAYRKKQAALPANKRNSAKEQFFIEHAIRLREQALKNPGDLASTVIGYLPNMMFFLLPIYALLLKLLYIRRNWYYVEHLIFALHIHTVFFIFFGVTLLLNHPIVQMSLRPTNIGTVLINILWVLFTVYGVVAAKVVYKQGIFKTIIKAGILLYHYALFLILALAGIAFYTFIKI